MYPPFSEERQLLISFTLKEHDSTCLGQWSFSLIHLTEIFGEQMGVKGELRERMTLICKQLHMATYQFFLRDWQKL